MPKFKYELNQLNELISEVGKDETYYIQMSGML